MTKQSDKSLHLLLGRLWKNRRTAGAALFAEISQHRNAQILIEALCVRSYALFGTSLFHCTVWKNDVVVADVVYAAPIEGTKSPLAMELIPGIQIHWNSGYRRRSQMQDGRHYR